MEENTDFKNRDRARVAGGLMLVGVGAALFTRNMGYVELPFWLFTWPMIVILAGIYQGVKHNFSNNGWIITIGVGLFFLVDKFLPTLRFQPAFWPLLIIGIGILFIVRPGKKNFWSDSENIDKNNWKKPITETIEPSAFSSADKSDFLRLDSVFSGVDKAVLSKNFQGGKIACVFGGAEIDLLQADIHGNVLLKIDVVFGGVKLIIPSHWSVQTELEGAFHSVEDKRKYATTAVDPGKLLLIKGSCVFGGIEIKSY